jgi:hypothetical protein
MSTGIWPSSVFAIVAQSQPSLSPRRGPRRQQPFCGSGCRVSRKESNMRRRATVRIFLADGSPEGLRLVEKSNWTGHALVCPRARFAEIKSRRQFNRPGVYALLGPPSSAELPLVYVGEGDPVRPRLEKHHREKDFWTPVVMFTSSAENLNQAHIQYHSDIEKGVNMFQLRVLQKCNTLRRWRGS